MWMYIYTIQHAGNYIPSKKKIIRKLISPEPRCGDGRRFRESLKLQHSRDVKVGATGWCGARLHLWWCVVIRHNSWERERDYMWVIAFVITYNYLFVHVGRELYTDWVPPRNLNRHRFSLYSHLFISTFIALLLFSFSWTLYPVVSSGRGVPLFFNEMARQPLE